MAGEGDVRAILSRIDERLKKVGLTDRGASLAAGMSADLIRSMRKQSSRGSQHGVMMSTLEALAVPLLTYPEYLLSGKGKKEREKSLLVPVRATVVQSHRAPLPGVTAVTPYLLPVIGVAVAGTWHEETPLGDAFKLEQYKVPSDPRFPADKQYAVYVGGTSLSRLFQIGDLLMVTTGIEPQNLDVVIVERVKGDLHELTAKRYIHSEHGIELHFDSTDQRWSDQLPIKLPHPDLKEVDDTQIVIRGVVVGLYRPLKV